MPWSWATAPQRGASCRTGMRSNVPAVTAWAGRRCTDANPQPSNKPRRSGGGTRVRPTRLWSCRRQWQRSYPDSSNSSALSTCPVWSLQRRVGCNRVHDVTLWHPPARGPAPPLLVIVSRGCQGRAQVEDLPASMFVCVGVVPVRRSRQ
jgi:hypothetical protein